MPPPRKHATPAAANAAGQARRRAAGIHEIHLRLSAPNHAWASAEVARRLDVRSIAALVNEMMDEARWNGGDVKANENQEQAQPSAAKAGSA